MRERIKYNRTEMAAISKLASMAPMVSDKLAVAYIDMGQGDCTMVKLPNDRVVVIDCGSSGGLEPDSFEAAQELLRSWANGNSIDVILTHPDKDHYNKIRLLVSETSTLPQVEINNIYFSRSSNPKSPLGRYKEDGLPKNLGLLGFPRLVEITINNTDGSKNEQRIWPKILGYSDSLTTALDSKELVLYQGKTSTGKDWRLSIIAGNVQTISQSASIQSNCVSLVTLVQLDTDKLLFTGDATPETLDFLYNNQAECIKDVAVFQIPHHGSESTQPTSQFKALVNPESLRVSVGFLNDSYKLPRYSILDSWLSCQRLLTTKGVIDVWKTPQELSGYDTQKKLEAILYDKWMGYKYEGNLSKTFFYLKDPADAQKSGTGFYAFTNTGYFLFREAIKKDIWETGINGTKDDEGFEIEIFK